LPATATDSIPDAIPDAILGGGTPGVAPVRTMLDIPRTLTPSPLINLSP